MKISILIIFVLFGLMQQNCDQKPMNNSEVKTTPTPKAAMKYDRLPDNIKPDTQVSKEIRNDKGVIVSSEITTVEKRLAELKAVYKDDILVDGNGKEIRFFDPMCRGVSAGLEEDAEYQKGKDTELAELRKKYTVLVLVCDPRNVM